MPRRPGSNGPKNPNNPNNRGTEPPSIVRILAAMGYIV